MRILNKFDPQHAIRVFEQQERTGIATFRTVMTRLPDALHREALLHWPNHIRVNLESVFVNVASGRNFYRIYVRNFVRYAKKETFGGAA